MAHAATIAPAPSIKAPLAWSAVLHSLLLAGLFFAQFERPGEIWGGAGSSGGVTVGLVRNLAGVPLPKPDAVTTSRVVDETRGLHKEEPKPKEPETPAEPIPEFTRNKPPKYVTRPSKVLEDETPPPEGAIPYGQGGAPAIPYTQFSLPGQTTGGIGFGGPSGGDFSARYPWYVEAVRRRISSSWLLSTVDPGLRWAPRVVVTFQILGDGSITNVEVQRSSGNASVDNSARRAVLDSSPLERLPADYSGSKVNVEFWFDFRR